MTRILGALFALAGLVGGVVAFDEAALAADAEYRIQVSPALLDLDLKPGETVKKNIEIANTGTKPFKFVTDVAPYSVQGEEYVTDFESDTKYTQLSDWTKLSKDGGTLAPGENLEVTVTISVPKDAPGGGQYAVLLAQLVDAHTEGVAVSQRVGVLVYANIDGEVKRSGKILENKVASFRFNPPLEATSVVENTGNIHQQATYVLEVSPLFGKDVIYSNEENPITKTILPETRRFNSIAWEGAPKLGIFRVKQIVTFAGNTTETEKLVILCPVWLLFIVILVVICAVFWIVSRVISRKNRF